MIKPTVGRVVLFWPTVEYAAQCCMAYGDPSQPLAAIVTYVHGDRMVNLTVHDHNGVPYGVCSVPLVQEDDVARPGAFYCEWMPYQKGQAAKTEAVESDIRSRLREYDLGTHSADPLAKPESLEAKFAIAFMPSAASVEPAKVTPEHLESVIASEHYFNGAEAAGIGGTEPHPLDLLTFCALTLRNGYTITGQSIPQVTAEFDARRGRERARENAIEQLWPLELYLLKQRLYEQEQDAEQLLIAELDAGKAAAESLVDHIEGMGSNVGSILVRRGALQYRIKIELDHD
jgi:hypothetical protein